MHATQSKATLQKLSTELHNIRCANVRALIRDLFPIQHIPAKPLSGNNDPAPYKPADDDQLKRNLYSTTSDDSNMENSVHQGGNISNDKNDKQFTACEDNCILSDEQLWDLVEASNTVYVNGKWISLRDDNDDKHSILSAKIPTNGDCQAYFIWSKSI